MSSSIPPHRPPSPGRRAEAPPFHSSSLRSFPSQSRSHRPGLSAARTQIRRLPHGGAYRQWEGQPLTRAGLDWTDKYPSAIAALANLNVKTAYIDGELCGVDEAGLPTFAHTQAATDGERNVQLVYYAFDLLHLDGRDVSALQLIERKALLEPLLANKPAIRSMAVRRKRYFKGPRDDRREVVAIDRRAGSTPQSGPVFSTFPPRERCLRAGYFERWVDPPRQLRPAQGEKCRMRPAVGGISRPRCAPHEVQACRHAGRGRFVAFGRRAEGARIAATATGRVATNASASSDTIAN